MTSYDDWYDSLPSAEDQGETVTREDSEQRTQKSLEFQVSTGKHIRVLTFERQNREMSAALMGRAAIDPVPTSHQINGYGVHWDPGVALQPSINRITSRQQVPQFSAFGHAVNFTAVLEGGPHDGEERSIHRHAWEDGVLYTYQYGEELAYWAEPDDDPAAVGLSIITHRYNRTGRKLGPTVDVWRYAP